MMDLVNQAINHTASEDKVLLSLVLHNFQKQAQQLEETCTMHYRLAQAKEHRARDAAKIATLKQEILDRINEGDHAILNNQLRAAHNKVEALGNLVTRMTSQDSKVPEEALTLLQPVRVVASTILRDRYYACDEELQGMRKDHMSLQQDYRMLLNLLAANMAETGHLPSDLKAAALERTLRDIAAKDRVSQEQDWAAELTRANKRADHASYLLTLLKSSVPAYAKIAETQLEEFHRLLQQQGYSNFSDTLQECIS
jgi:hypothetical protein